MKYEALFSPIKIGKCELKNRVAMPPMLMGFGKFDGTPTEKMMNYYEERAKGGAGLIVTEITRVNDVTGATSFSQLAVSRDYHVAPLAEMAKRIQKHGAKFFVQLHHPGRQNIGLMVKTIPLCIKMDKVFKGFAPLLYKLAPTFGKILVSKRIVPASVSAAKIEPSYFSGGRVRALRKREILKLITQFAEGAERVKEAGCDGVMLHAAHGYLIQQFLSPHTNRRTDEFGGSVGNRMRFLKLIVEAIREKCGDFPIIVRLSADECYDRIGYPERGYGLDEGVRMAKAIEAMGVDAIDVSSACYDAFNYWLEPMSFETGWRKYMAKAVKDAVDIPVLAANVIRSAEQAETQIQEGYQDIVCLGRPHIADPHWANKVAEGRENEIKRCISCLYCFESMQNNAYHGGHGGCSVNPFIGRERKELKADGNGRLVLIIGAGPAGLTAAELSAKRGFKAVVLEKEASAGGQVAVAGLSKHSEKINWCITDLERAALFAGAEIKYNTEATEEIIDGYNPYAIIYAAGGEPVIPRSVEGVNGDNVFTAADVYKGKMRGLSGKAAVIGSGMTGLGAAWILTENENDVAVVEMADSVAPGMWMQHTDNVMQELLAANVSFYTGHRLVKIEKDCVVLEELKTKTEKRIEADYTVLSVGVRPVNGLYNKIKGKYERLYPIGDVVKTGRIAHATEDAFNAVEKL